MKNHEKFFKKVQETLDKHDGFRVDLDMRKNEYYDEESLNICGIEKDSCISFSIDLKNPDQRIYNRVIALLFKKGYEIISVDSFPVTDSKGGEGTSELVFFAVPNRVEPRCPMCGTIPEEFKHEERIVGDELPPHWLSESVIFRCAECGFDTTSINVTLLPIKGGDDEKQEQD